MATESPGLKAGLLLVRTRRVDVAAVLALCLAAVGLMGPAAWRLNDVLYGIGADGLAGPAGIAQRLDGIRAGGLLAPLPMLFGRPFLTAGAIAAVEPLYWYRGAALALVLSPVGAANVLLFVGLAGTAVAVYAYLRWNDLPIAAALLGALVYGFSPIRLAEGQEHFTLLEGFWLVWECALLQRLAAGRGRPALLGLCLGLCLLDSAYLGYIGALFAGAWFAVLLARALLGGDRRSAVATVRQGLIALGVLAVVAIPPQVPLLRAGAAPVASVTVVRNSGDLDRLSLRWWNFLLPSPDNPILGPLGRATFRAKLGVDTVSEQSTMIGYVALALALAGLTGRTSPPAPLPGAGRGNGDGMTGGKPGVRHRSSPPAWDALRRGEEQGVRSVALTAVVAGILFGLPPSFQVGPLRLPMPPALMHMVLPAFRTTSRLDLLIQLGVAILAALGAQQLFSRIRRQGWRRAAVVVLALAIMLEYVNVPSWRHIALLPAPPLDTWLASLTAQQTGIIAQYPMYAADQAGMGFYGFYAFALHHHPLFNGVPTGTPPDALRRNVLDVLNPTTPASLAALGIATMTIDDAYYRLTFSNAGLRWNTSAGRPAGRLPAGLALQYQDAGTTAYAVTAAPAGVLAGLGDQFGATELRLDGREWHWMGGRATVWVDGVADGQRSVVLFTSAHNNGGAHALSVPGYLPIPVSSARVESAVALPVVAAPGLHPLEVAAGGGVGPVPGGGAAPAAAVQLRSLEPAPLRPLAVAFLEGGRPRWELVSAAEDACSAQAGATVDVALLWQVMAPTDADQTVFLHLVDASGALVQQDDGRPNGGSAATSLLPAGTRLVDAHRLELPAALPPGTYRLHAGLYDSRTGTRLARAGGGDTVEVGAVTVTAPSDGPTRRSCAW